MEAFTSFVKTKNWDDWYSFWDNDGQAHFIATNFVDNYKILLTTINGDGKKIDMDGRLRHAFTSHQK